MSTTALLPVSFRNTTLSLVAHQGQPFVAMRQVVEGMGMAWQSQHAKLSSTPRWGVTKIVTPSNGGEQEAICLPLRKLPGWLASISPNKVRPELRETVIAYQNECDDALWAYWESRQPAAPTKPAALGDKLTAAHARDLQEMVAARVQALPKAHQAGAWPKLWGAVKSHFRIPEYRELPDAQFDAACSLIARLPLEGEVLAHVPPLAPPVPAAAIPLNASGRWLVQRDAQGQVHAVEVPDNALVLTTAQFCRTIGAPDGLRVDTESLAALIQGATARLAGRAMCHSPQNARLAA